MDVGSAQQYRLQGAGDAYEEYLHALEQASMLAAEMDRMNDAQVLWQLTARAIREQEVDSDVSQSS